MEKRDKAFIAKLAEASRGLPVKVGAAEQFAAYEAAGWVKLSRCLCGPLRQPDPEFFWAKVTPEGAAEAERIYPGQEVRVGA